jgi:predicted porin
MKKSLLALAALTAFAGVASAQSSVTLFGVVDVNARSQKNGSDAIRSLSQDGNASSRIGLRGVEDLGGGLRAGFWIEGAINPDTGTPGGQTWQRRSTLSLMGGFGELRLGRDYTPTFWNHTVFDPFGTNGVGSQTNLMTQQGQTSVVSSGATTLVRANNTIGYFLPSGLGGLYGQAQIAAGEGVGGNKYQGFRIGYGAGPANVAVAWGKTEVGTDDLKAMNIGGSFAMGPVTLYGQYHKYKATLEQKNWMLGASFGMGAGTLKASYGKASGDADGKQFAFGYVYDLSKRTALYAAYARINNGDSSRFVTSGSGPTMGAGDKSTGYEFGVRHSF